MNKLGIMWRYSKLLLYIILGIAVLVPAAGGLWFILEVDIPFLHSGDRLIGRSLIVLWWLCCTVLIFGWRLKDNE